jgi:acetyl-CoA acetyltransferase
MTPRAAITGVGYTELTKRSGRSVLDLATEACRQAIGDAGLVPSDIDGVASFSVMHDSVPCQAVATTLAVPELRYALDVDLGGQAPCHLVRQAAAAVSTAQARHVLVFRAMNGRSGPRVGTMQFHGMGAQYRYPIGYDAYLMYVAMWAQRFLYETGQTSEDLAAVAIAQRQFAAGNDRAFRRQPLDLETYLGTPLVVDPFRPQDCTVEVDGGCAVVVSALDRARHLPRPPAVIASGAYRAGPRSGLDIGDHLSWDDYSRNYTSLLRDELFGSAGLQPSDVQVAEIYDCFTSTVLIGLEGLGLCDRGGSGALVRSGATGPGGILPTNTHGGLLSEGYLHGMNTVAEAALQIQGRGGCRQAPGHEVAVVTSGALMDGSALILTSDR